jgi:histidinol-phosphatase (PHP family)
MRQSCLHTHTIFCDGQDSIETLCQAAYDAGLVAIGFSAHAPITRKTGWKTDWHLPDERLDEYLDELRKARHRWRGRLRVLIGLEIDFIAGVIGPADKDYRKLELDYSIGSIHYMLPMGGEPFTIDGSPEEFERGLHNGFRGNIEELVNAYWNVVEAMIYAGGFDILGHVDLIKKNNIENRWFSQESWMYRERLSRIETIIAASKVAVEVNTGGLNRGSTRETYPSLPLLRLLCAKNVPVIITADAHSACHINGNYETAASVLREAGYKKTVLYWNKDKKPVNEAL